MCNFEDKETNKQSNQFYENKISREFIKQNSDLYIFYNLNSKHNIIKESEAGNFIVPIVRDYIHILLGNVFLYIIFLIIGSYFEQAQEIKNIYINITGIVKISEYSFKVLIFKTIFDYYFIHFLKKTIKVKYKVINIGTFTWLILFLFVPYYNLINNKVIMCLINFIVALWIIFSRALRYGNLSDDHHNVLEYSKFHYLENYISRLEIYLDKNNQVQETLQMNFNNLGIEKVNVEPLYVFFPKNKKINYKLEINLVESLIMKENSNGDDEYSNGDAEYSNAQHTLRVNKIVTENQLNKLCNDSKEVKYRYFLVHVIIKFITKEAWKDKSNYYKLNFNENNKVTEISSLEKDLNKLTYDKKKWKI